MINKVFVYGTLRKNAMNPCENYGGKHLGVTELSGATMYSLGPFPGIKLTARADETVLGDVYEVDQSIIRHLDGYEGYSEAYESQSLYLRKTVTVPDFGEVYVYEYNGRPDNRPVVPNGDWLNYVNKGN
jgi:gamma-glutamylcyclotransferase (GGCT)/AIG2-like uncharacterized protein YtfP